jgi:hypothetical protein
MPSGGDFRFAGAPDDSGRWEREAAPLADTQPVAHDGGIEKLRALTDLLRRECRVHLPRATPLPPIRDPRAAPAAKAVPNRLAIRSDERWPTVRPRPRRSSPGRMALLGGALVIVLCAGVMATRWAPALDVADASGRAPDDAQRMTLASLPQTGPSAAGGEPRTMSRSDDAAGSGTVAGLPLTLPARARSTATGAANTAPGAGSAHQPWPDSSATALADVRDAKPAVEAEAQPVAGATCYPSAMAVTQDHPDAWPAWTQHAPGHEGVRCWHATTRAAARDRRTETPQKKPRVATPDNPVSPPRPTD